MEKAEYYLEKQYESIPGERWRSILGFEGYYEISSLGRVKSIDRYIPHVRLGQQFIKGRILSQKVIQHRNLLTGKPSIDLQVALSMDGHMTFRNIRRLVYAAFVEEINYNDDNLCVINTNGNGFDCTVGNLSLVSVQEKSVRAYKRKRVGDSHLKYADRTTWPLHGGSTRRKAVVQYDLKGNVINRFESISQASKETGIGEKEIIGVAKGRYKRWGNCVWKYLD
ncbi:MAG: NUMOD4 domain-containing protein [Cyclobacteriaceae bacterium]